MSRTVTDDVKKTPIIMPRSDSLLSFIPDFALPEPLLSPGFPAHPTPALPRPFEVYKYANFTYRHADISNDVRIRQRSQDFSEAVQKDDNLWSKQPVTLITNPGQEINSMAPADFPGLYSNASSDDTVVKNSSPNANNANQTLARPISPSPKEIIVRQSPSLRLSPLSTILQREKEVPEWFDESEDFVRLDMNELVQRTLAFGRVRLFGEPV